MNDFMKTILKRVLSEEIGNQMRWKDEEIKKYGESLNNRDDFIKEIKKFMEENNIDIDYDYICNAYYQ